MTRQHLGAITLTCLVACGADDADNPPTPPTAGSTGRPSLVTSATASPSATTAVSQPSAPSNTSSSGSADPTTGAPPVELLFHEDFEQGNPGEPPNPDVWEVTAGEGTAELSTQRAIRASMHSEITSPSGSYETYIFTSAPFPVAGNRFWGRLRFYVDALPYDDFVHWTVMEARGTDNNNRVRIGGINNPHGGDFFSNTWILNVETQGQGEIGASDPLESPDQTWFCLEWFYDGTPNANEARVFIDGVESKEMHQLDDFFPDVDQMPTYDPLYIGWGIYQPISFPYEVWIDDVAVHDQRIGCE